MPESVRSERPNILILLSDQHRADAFSCTDHPVVRTPNLDSLAAEGVQFSNAYTQSPLCVPARASMYLGVYPHNTQICDFSSWVPDHATTFFEHLQESGYYTAHIGEADQKTWLTTEDGEDLRDNQEFLENMGFDYVHQTIDPWKSRTIDSPVTDYWEEQGLLETTRSDLDERYSDATEYDLWEEGGFSVNWPSPLDPEDHLDGYTCRQAIEFIEGYDREEPFALFVGIPGPHEPLDPPAEYAGMYDPAEMPDPIPPAEHGDWVPEDVAAFVDHEIGKRPDELDPAHVREVQAAYYAEISHIDHWIGRLLDTLDSEGLREDTLTIYTSDHGELAGDHARFAKHCFFEPSVRIPMIVSQPGSVPQGETSTALVELIDLYPTALDVAGATETGNTFGSSLLRAAGTPENPQASDRRAVMSVFHDRVMYLTREYKYAIDGNGLGYMLYDRTDSDEQENLIGHPEHEVTERDLREQLLRFYHRTATQYRRNGDGFRVVG